MAGIVAIGAIARAAVGLARATPTYFPDEYLYSALGRSIAETGRPLVRGANAHTPALLEPFLTSPAWLIGNTAVAYHVAQAISATAMSLAAIPVYLVCCRLGLRRATALAAAAAAISLPALMYATTLVAEPFAYPLALGAVAAGTIALGSGGRRAQAAFLVFAAAAAMTRAQLLVIPLAYVVAAFVVGARTRTLRRMARQQAYLFGALALPLLALLLLHGRLLGIYGHAGAVSFDPAELSRAVTRNGLVLLYGAGWVIVPGAVLGLVATIVRPRSRLELSFGAFAGSVAAAVILQASLWGDTDRPQERYFLYAIPLVAVLFGITAERGWPWKRAYALVVAGTVLVAALIPLSGYAASTWKTQSPTLYGVFTIEEHLGTATGALVVALVATGLSLVALGLPRLPTRQSGAVGIGLACGACLVLAAAATDLDLQNSRLARRASLPTDRAWVDHAHVGHVTLLRGAANRGDTFEQLFWNRSIKRVLLLPAAEPLDTVEAGRRVTISPDGTLHVHKQLVTGAVLVDEWQTAIRFRSARVLGSSPANVLVVPQGRVQIESYATGFYRDGLLGRTGRVHVWPATVGGRLHGILSFRLNGPTWLDSPVKLRVVRDGGTPLTIRIAAGRTTTVRLAVCARGPWNAGFSADRAIAYGDRAISVAATPPQWRPTPGAGPVH